MHWLAYYNDSIRLLESQCMRFNTLFYNLSRINVSLSHDFLTSLSNVFQEKNNND